MWKKWEEICTSPIHITTDQRNGCDEQQRKQQFVYWCWWSFTFQSAQGTLQMSYLNSTKSPVFNWSLLPYINTPTTGIFLVLLFLYLMTLSQLQKLHSTKWETKLHDQRKNKEKGLSVQSIFRLVLTYFYLYAFPERILPARPARWSADACDTGTTTRESV